MINQHQQVLHIAFASSNEIELDEHFGNCQQLMIYRLSLENKEHINTHQFVSFDGHNQQKIGDRLAALTDCFAVYCLACGTPVRKQLLAQGIRVVVHPQVELIDDLLSKIQDNWPGDIARRHARQLNKKKDANYFNTLTESEWA